MARDLPSSAGAPRRAPLDDPGRRDVRSRVRGGGPRLPRRRSTLHAPDGDPMGRRRPGGSAPLDPADVGATRPDQPRPAACRRRRRGRAVSRPSRRRLGGAAGGDPLECRTPRAPRARGQHDHDAVRPQPLPLAGPLLRAQGGRALARDADRSVLAETPDPRGLSERDRMGPRDLRRRGGGPLRLRHLRRPPRCAPGRAPRGGVAESAALAGRRAQSHGAPPRGPDRAPRP